MHINWTPETIASILQAIWWLCTLLPVVLALLHVKATKQLEYASTVARIVKAATDQYRKVKAAQGGEAPTWDELKEYALRQAMGIAPTLTHEMLSSAIEAEVAKERRDSRPLAQASK